MAGHSVEAKREVMAEPEQVWRVLTDIDNATKVLTGVTKIERLEGDGYEVGTKWRETRRMFGKEESEEMWVSAVDAPRTTTVQAESGSTTYSTVFTCQPSSLGTTLRVVFSAQTTAPGLGQKIGWAVFGKAGMKATEKVLRQDLDDIAKAAESRAKRR